MREQSPNAKQGFTLIEALMGTGVFTLGVLGSVGLMAWIMQATASSGRMVSASALGQAQLEELIDDGYDHVQSGSGTEGQYDLTWTVTTTNGCQEIAIDVEWTNSQGQDKKISLASMVASETTVAALPGFAQTGNGGVGGIPTGSGGEPSPDTEPVTE